MSAIAFLRQLLDDGLELTAALIAADRFERTRAGARYVEPADEKVWVYVMAVDDPGDRLIKVGISKHPNFRLHVLEKERGYDLYLAHTEGPFTRPSAARIERLAHEALRNDRERGEWFTCGVERAAKVVSSAAAEFSR